jgi:tRNA-dihydrouridine synthase B
MSIRLPNLTLRKPVILAPMSGVTDRPFRRLVKRYGVGLVVSEMIASRSMVQRTRESMRLARHGAEEFPVALQLAGHDPEVMAEAAKLNEDLGAAVIDLNFGCPVKKVVNKLAGSALMRDERLAARIMSAVVAAVRVPVTLKMRLGWDQSSRNAARLARIAEGCGIRMITVHARTRCQFYEGLADWSAVAEVRQASSLPIIVNGDIRSLSDAKRALALSGADGVMIGRGACGRPWLLARIAAALRGETAPREPSLAERREIVTGHYEDILCHYGDLAGMRVARKHLAWYASDLPQGSAFRAAVYREDNPERVKALIARAFAPELESLAA